MLRLFASFLLALVAILGLVHAVPLEKRDEHTPAEAAALARQLVTKTRIAELATKFHSSTDPELEAYPFNMVELISPDCQNSGHLLVLLVAGGLHATNVISDPSATISIRDLDGSSERGVMDDARLLLMGKLQPSQDASELECFYQAHPDTRSWQGHKFALYKLTDLKRVRWIGGFGDRHYVGWLDVELYFGSNGEEGEVKETRTKLTVQRSSDLEVGSW